MCALLSGRGKKFSASKHTSQRWLTSGGGPVKRILQCANTSAGKKTCRLRGITLQYTSPTFKL